MSHDGIPVLTYHAQNINGNEYRNNDHVCLARDLELIAELGLKVRPLPSVIDALFENGDREILERAVCITFDDGTLFDVADLEHPTHGHQTGMLQIMAQFARDHAELEWRPHATSFVIASPEVRKVLEKTELAGEPWLGEDWWQDAEASEFMCIGNHSWDHRHSSVIPAVEGGGDFNSVNDEPKCRHQIIEAARYIGDRTGRWPGLFAYPFGHASDYLRNEFFPQFAHEHGTRAAFGTQSGYLNSETDRWYVPRFICGYHWKNEETLRQILAG